MIKTVVIVDDSNFMRNLINILLTRHNFNVINMVSNGTMAIRTIMDKRPDIVTLDLKLPDMSGLEVLKRLKDYGTRSKIIIVSGINNESNMQEECIRLGANGFIYKPFVREDLINLINRII